jgi:hypothetical protein
MEKQGGPRQISRVGVFHFGGCDKGDPVASLEVSLSEAETFQGDLSNCLIVLPEAFNIRTEYDRDCRPEGEICCALRDLSVRRNVALVVGLLESSGEGKPYNSAFLIDGDFYALLSRKISDGGKGVYRFPEDTDNATAIAHGGVCVAGLICMDAKMFCQRGEWFGRLREKLRSTACARRVLCVPARFSDIDPEELTQCFHLPGVTIAISNGNSLHASLIVPRSGKRLPFKDSETKSLSPICSRSDMDRGWLTGQLTAWRGGQKAGA